MNQEQTLTADWSAVDVNDEEESKPASGVESEWACDIWKALKERLLRNRKGKWCNFDDSETVPSMGFLEIKVKLDRGFFNLWWKQTHEEVEEEEEAIICIALSIIINGYNWEFDCYFFSCIIFEDEHGARLFFGGGKSKEKFRKENNNRKIWNNSVNDDGPVWRWALYLLVSCWIIASNNCLLFFRITKRTYYYVYYY